MQSPNDFEREFEKVRTRVDDVCLGELVPDNVQTLKGEAERLRGEIQECIRQLQHLSKCGLRGSDEMDCTCRMDRWKQQLQKLDLFDEDLEDYRREIGDLHRSIEGNAKK